jgi:hypothetical protein
LLLLLLLPAAAPALSTHSQLLLLLYFALTSCCCKLIYFWTLQLSLVWPSCTCCLHGEEDRSSYSPLCCKILNSN